MGCPVELTRVLKKSKRAVIGDAVKQMTPEVERSIFWDRILNIASFASLIVPEVKWKR